MENTSTEVGARLRELREKKGLTVEDISRRLKIPVRTLLSMENGNYEQLPHPVYARNFVKMYARELEMNPEEVEAYLNTLFGSAPEVQHAAVYRPVDEDSSSVAWKLPLFIILGIGLLAGGGWWIYKNLFSADSSQTHPVSIDQSVTPEAALAPAPVEQTAEAPAGERSGDLEMGDAPHRASPASAPILPNLAVPSPKEETPPASVDSGASVASESDGVIADKEKKRVEREETNAEKHEVVIDAQIADCWIRVTKPGEENKDIFLHKGQSVSLRYGKEMMVRFGNIYGVIITEDGRPVDSPKNGAPVRTLSFPL